MAVSVPQGPRCAVLFDKAQWLCHMPQRSCCLLPAPPSLTIRSRPNGPRFCCRPQHHVWRSGLPGRPCVCAAHIPERQGRLTAACCPFPLAPGPAAATSHGTGDTEASASMLQPVGALPPPRVFPLLVSFPAPSTDCFLIFLCNAKPAVGRSWRRDIRIGRRQCGTSGSRGGRRWVRNAASVTGSRFT